MDSSSATQLDTQPSSSSSSSSPIGSDFFTRHNDSVLCCSIDNRTRLAVSGGIDDTAFIWDLNTKHVIFECLDHKESVVAAAFSLNSTYVATGDLNGYIQVRNTTTGLKVFDYEIDEINWILWHNNSEYVLLAGTTKGDFWMWNVNDPAAIKTFPSFGSSCTAARILPDGVNIVVAYQDGAIRVFDLKTRQVIFRLTEPNSAEIISMDVNPKKSIFAVGSMDSSIRLITINILRHVGTVYCKTPETPTSVAIEQGEPMDESSDQAPASSQDDDAIDTDQVDPAHAEELEVIDEYSRPDDKSEGTIADGADEEDEEEDDELSDDGADDGTNTLESVESVLFSPCGNILAASNNSGTITFWDVSSQVVRCEKHTGVGITRCAWTDDGRYITGCLDGTIRVYDINLTEVTQIPAHKDQILDIDYRQGMLVSASEDKTCRVIRL